MKKILLTALLAGTPLAWSAEGMWTLDNPPLAKLKAELGVDLDPAWFQRVMRGSARIAGGCSASFVSPEGLVLTNHHCAVGCVEQV
ncbi:MAG: S46 family peptidase, partial [Roseateles sp.]